MPKDRQPKFEKRFSGVSIHRIPNAHNTSADFSIHMTSFDVKRQIIVEKIVKKLISILGFKRQ